MPIPPFPSALIAPTSPHTYVNATVVLPSSTLPVASTVGFPTQGSILVNTNVGGLFTPQSVNYTGITAGSFTGVTGWTAGSTGQGATVDLNSAINFSAVAVGWTDYLHYLGPTFSLMTVTGATGTPQV